MVPSADFMVCSALPHGVHAVIDDEVASFANGGNTMTATIDSGTTTRGIWRLVMWGGLLALLSLPALAMSLGAAGVDWSASDFMIMGVLLAILGLSIETAVRILASWRARLAAIAMAILVFLSIWAELAVGVFDTPFAGS
jgi:hypothetical protein